jgi:hypothetical protein
MLHWLRYKRQWSRYVYNFMFFLFIGITTTGVSLELKLWTYIFICKYIYMFYFLFFSLTYTKCKLVCFPLKGLSWRLDILMQSGTDVTWRLMFSVLPPVSSDFCTTLYDVQATRWCSWFRDCTTSRKVAGSIPDDVIGIFLFSGCTIALGLTQPLTEMSTRNISWG